MKKSSLSSDFSSFSSLLLFIAKRTIAMKFRMDEQMHLSDSSMKKNLFSMARRKNDEFFFQ